MQPSGLARGLALVLCVSSVAGCRRTGASEAGTDERDQNLPIVMITIDTLRADHLGSYGYFRDTTPRIDAFAAEAVRFARAVTPMATTLPAHTSMLTSTRPLRHGVVKNGLVFEPEDNLESVAQVLARRGYTTGAFVSASPVSAETGIDVGFQTFDEPEGTSRRSEVTVKRALEWLDGRSAGAPLFLWIHLWDPHAPYEPAEGWAGHFETDEALLAWLERLHIPEVYTLGSMRFDTREIHNLYDDEIRYTDHWVGELLDGLRARGLYEDTVIALASDHGEGLWQHDWHDHGRIYNEQIFVPFVLKPPKRAGLAARVVEDLASTLDLVPTALPLAGVHLSEGEAAQIEGVNLFAETRKYTFTERVNRHRKRWEPGDKYALVTDRYKYFARSEADDQLFDLEEDFVELSDVHPERPRVAARLERQIQTIFAGYLMRGGRKDRATGSAGLLKKLEALGYLQ